MVRQVAKSLPGFTTTVSPSIATWSSTQPTPEASQFVASDLASAASLVLIGREASLISVSPAQNFLKPPPVPANATGTWTPGLASWNSSATAWVIGKTVLEPSIVTVPDRAAPLAALDGALEALPLEQAPAAMVASRASAARRFGVEIVTRWILLVAAHLGRAVGCGTVVVPS